VCGRSGPEPPFGRGPENLTFEFQSFKHHPTNQRERGQGRADQGDGVERAVLTRRPSLSLTRRGSRTAVPHAAHLQVGRIEGGGREERSHTTKAVNSTDKCLPLCLWPPLPSRPLWRKPWRFGKESCLAKSLLLLLAVWQELCSAGCTCHTARLLDEGKHPLLW
jgi:hypothetical protein